MVEQLKSIVEHLKRPPFNRKEYTILTFDRLTNNQLLQVLTDVFAVIDPNERTHKVDIRDEEPEKTAARHMTMLRMLGYKPRTDVDANTFRQNLVSGEKSALFPILQWLLEKVPEHKERAYLGRYLSKLEIPNEFLNDPEIAEQYDRYDELMEEFKEAHRAFKETTSTPHTIDDLRRDIKQLEEEKETLEKRLERQKTRIQKVPASQIDLAKNYRKEVEKEEKLNTMKQDLSNAIQQFEQKIQRIERQIADQKASASNQSPEAILKRMDDDNNINSYLVTEKFPKQLAQMKNRLKYYEEVANNKALGQTELANYRAKITELNSAINKFHEKRVLAKDPTADNLAVFRQQALIVARRKDQTAETLTQLRAENEVLEKQMGGGSFSNDARSTGHGKGSHHVPQGEEFQRYVNMLRTKGNTYKRKRQEINEITAEIQTLKRTEELLREQVEQIKSRMTVEERKQGLEGFFSTQERLEELQTMKMEQDELKGKSLEEITGLCKTLNTRISSKKAELDPILKEVKALRAKINEVKDLYEAKKSKYDSLNGQFESGRASLESEVSGFYAEQHAQETRFHTLKAHLLLNAIYLKRAEDETASYVSKNKDTKSYRDQLNKQISDAEARLKSAKERSKNVKDVSIDGTKQVKYWGDLLRMLEMKRRLATGET